MKGQGLRTQLEIRCRLQEQGQFCEQEGIKDHDDKKRRQRVDLGHNMGKQRKFETQELLLRKKT